MGQVGIKPVTRKSFAFWYPAVLVVLVLAAWLIFEGINVALYFWKYATWDTPLKIDHWGLMWLTFGFFFGVAVVWWRTQFDALEGQRGSLEEHTRKLEADLNRVATQWGASELRLRHLEGIVAELGSEKQQLSAELAALGVEKQQASARVQQLEAREIELTERVRFMETDPAQVRLESTIQELRDQVRRLQNRLHIPAVYNLGDLMANKLWRDSMTPLIQSLFVEKHAQLQGILVEPQGGGYGGSLVLQAHLWFDGELKREPFIVKIGDQSLLDEGQNTQAAHADTHRVPSVHSGPLSVSGRDGEIFAGVVYDFARVDGTIQSFFDFYQAPGTGSGDVAHILEKIFTGLDDVWYGKRDRVESVSLCHEYQLIYEKRAEIKAKIPVILDRGDTAYQRQNLSDEANRQLSPRIRPAFCKQFPPLGNLWYDPICFLENWPHLTQTATLPFFRSKVHGDAHSRNLLIENNDRIWYIDLSHWPNGLSQQRTQKLIGQGFAIDPKRGHTLRDMSKLEADIKFVLTPLKSEGDWVQAVEFELALLEESRWGQTDLPEPHPRWVGSRELRKAWGAVQTIRRLATPYLCEPEDKRPYYWSLFQASLPILYYTTVEFGNEKRREQWQKRYIFTSAGLLGGRLWPD